MDGALVELVFLQVRGRLVRRIRLLRQPRYLLAFLVGLAYLGFVLIPRLLFSRDGVRRTTEALGPTDQILHLAVALALAAAVTGAWLLVSSQPALRLTETEIEFLLPAPLPRRQIVLYSLLRQQAGVLFSSLVLSVIRGLRLGSQGLFGFAVLWALLTIADLHLKAIGLWKARLKEIPPAAAVRRRALAVTVAAVWWSALSVSLWAAWQSAAAASPGHVDLGAFAASTAQRADRGAAGLLLAPFSWVSGAVAGRTVPGSVRAFLLLVLVVLHVEWVVRSRVSFEEATLERARRESARKGISRRELQARSARGREPFRLAAAGPPETAILWKNLMLRGRTPLRTLAAVIAVTTLAGGIAASLLPMPLAVILTVCGLSLLCGIPVVSGLTLRNDLRADLLHVEILRTWPIAGFRLVLGEILAPVTNAFLIMLLGCGLTAAGSAGDAVGQGEAHLVLLPASIAGAHPLLTLPVLLGSLLVAGLGVLFVSLAIQNLAVLLLPSWVGLGLSSRGGPAVLGQRLLLTLGHLLALVVAALPSLVVTGAVAAMHAFRHVPFHLWELPVLATLTAFLFAIEAALLLRSAGAVWDRLDVSSEVLSAAATD